MQLRIFNNIDINHPSTPYFQVEASERVRFAMTTLQKKPGLLKQIFKNMKFVSETKVDCTVLSAYEIGEIKRDIKLNLARRFDITNWKEIKIWNDDQECMRFYTTITKLSAVSLYKYILAFYSGHQRELNICFYNDEYLLYANGDVLDIVSSKNNIANLKDTFEAEYDRYHEEEGSGGYINIATVYSKDNDIKESLLAFLDYFVGQGSNVLKVRYSKDIDGEDWVEQELLGNHEALDILSYHYITFEISGKTLDLENSELMVSITQESEYYGFLINMKWDEVNRYDIEQATEIFIDSFKRFYLKSIYDYALIGHELEVEIPPEEFRQLIRETVIFPIAIVGEDSKLHIYKGSFGIDGISEQNGSYEVVDV
ncbi:Imm64 family immunity protein [Sutcliffiella horikoshii]|uniref:Imm64 family immunity protein n=1 Tax=Sutcliffiella horikoshii TaxID=79883 RepID=UPI002040B3EF|nr:Imm64 family immunity protein [Sutcliffiella horikoshii]MCM3618374.1 Imm64 family immunity protein [Sutcliffiella horikoshii]